MNIDDNVEETRLPWQDNQLNFLKLVQVFCLCCDFESKGIILTRDEVGEAFLKAYDVDIAPLLRLYVNANGSPESN